MFRIFIWARILLLFEHRASDGVWHASGDPMLTRTLATVAVTFRESAVAKGGEVADVYGKVAWLTIVIWIAYPLIWLFSEGFASFSVSFEVSTVSNTPLPHEPSL